MVLRSLKHSRKFWIAVFGLVQTILLHLLPDFPPDIWKAIDTLAGLLIITIAAEDVALKLAGRHVMQQLPAVPPPVPPTQEAAA